jgi:ribonucleoside-diphosphate reductase alpha chain
MKACVNCEGDGDDCFDPERTRRSSARSSSPRSAFVPDNYIKRVIQFARQGYTDDRVRHLRHRLGFGSLSHRLGPELQQFGLASPTISCAPSRTTATGTSPPQDGKVAKTIKARDLWEKIGYAAWASADPGMQYHTTINDWHTCPADGPINASNPCSEYMFLDDTACNLASLNLLQFRSTADGKAASTRGYEHAVRLWTVVLEISVMMAQFPSKEIASSPTSTARSASATPISAAC